MLIAQDDLNTLGFRTGGLDRNIWRQNRRSSKKLSKEQRATCRWNNRLQYMAFTTRRRSRNRKNRDNDRLESGEKGVSPLFHQIILQSLWDKHYKQKTNVLQIEKHSIIVYNMEKLR